MKALWNKTKNVKLASEVVEATSMWARTRGLLGKQSFPQECTMWIYRCNSIHTFFLKFPIDVIFVDENLIVQSTHWNLPAFRVTMPLLKAKSVFEFASLSGQRPVEVGDQLYVGH